MTTPPPTVRICPAAPEHEPAIRALLARCDLPHADIGPHLRHFHIAVSGDTIVGTVGAEVYASLALLRSLAVSASWRGRGTGRRLYENVESHVRSRGVTTLYLLTMSAAGLFGKLGFSVVSRDLVPEPIRLTGEFSFYCPGTAVCMMKTLVEAPQMPRRP